MTGRKSPTVNERAWEAATWEGSRRAQLRRSLRLSIRERLEALDDLARASEALVLPESGARSALEPDSMA